MTPAIKPLSHRMRGLSPTAEPSMWRYITSSGTTTELILLGVILAATWSANLYFHWFQ